MFPTLHHRQLLRSRQTVLIYFMSGTSILIVVGVALDMVEKVNALLVMRNYEGILAEGGEAAGATSGWGRRST